MEKTEKEVVALLTRRPKAMHRMSGTHIYSPFEWPRLPLIGDLDRSIKM
jgi:hypothetical protein